MTIMVGLVLLLPVGAVLQIVLTSQLDDRSQTQAIVVLDPATRYWGDPAPVLRARLGHAASLYRSGVAPVIVLTGPHRAEAGSRAELLADGVSDLRGRGSCAGVAPEGGSGVEDLGAARARQVVADVAAGDDELVGGQGAHVPRLGHVVEQDLPYPVTVVFDRAPLVADVIEPAEGDERVIKNADVGAVVVVAIVARGPIAPEGEDLSARGLHDVHQCASASADAVKPTARSWTTVGSWR
jgi:hypothetical protein